MARHNNGAGAPRREAPPVMGRFGPGHRGMETRKAKNARGTVARLWGYMKPETLTLVVAWAFVTASSGLLLCGPYLMTRAIDRYMRRHDLHGLAANCVLMVGLYLTLSVCSWLNGYLMAGAAQRVVRAIRRDLFAALQRLPLRFFDTRPHGDLMSRLTNDVENVSQVLTDSVSGLAFGLITLVGAAAMMLRLNTGLAAANIACVLLMTMVMGRWLASRIRDAFRAQQKSLGELNGLIEETVGGQRVVKAYHREDDAMAKFDRANGALRTASTKAQIYAGFMGPLMNGTNNVGLALIAGLGGWMAVRGMATVGTIAGFITYSRMFSRPLMDIANMYNLIQGAIAGAERVFEVIDEEPEVDAPAALSLEKMEGDVRFEEVSFSYVPGTPVLREVSLHAEPGQTVALIGPTGAGKTTIVNLLTRFYEIDRGTIRVDGVDIRELRKADLRRQLGIVLQDTFLFSGTVRDNIRYGRLEATDEEVEAAARLANAHAFIHRLPHGYDTHLSERGGNLSQGQRQLLSIARAILADPRILILDEATSSVDTRTERHIQEAMRRLMKGRTSFVIAHRLSTIREADQILVIDHGEIIERGSHAELLASHGVYHKLCSGQFGEVEDDAPAPPAPV